MNAVTDIQRGFTLIELLVVIAIIGLLASVVLISLLSTRNNSADTAVKANLRSALNQAQLFVNDNGGSYSGICNQTSPVGVAKTIYSMVDAAQSASGATGINLIGTAGDSTHATCHVDAGGSAWAADVPLKVTSNTWWCVDSTNIAKVENSALGADAVSCP